MMASLCLSENPKPSQLRRVRRREKSRDAARFRRHKESDTFEEICNTIPVPPDAINHLDKSAVMRLLISYIKLRQMLNKEIEVSELSGIKQEFIDDVASVTDDDYVNALNAFVLILSSDLDILYVSDNVKQYLGLSKLDLIGQSILTYAHEGDHDDVRNCFFTQKDPSARKSFFLRLKSTLTVNGKSINLKSASYKVLRCSGMVKSFTADASYMVAHVEPIPHPSNIQHFLDSKTFVTQHSPDMKFTYCDERFASLMAYEEDDMLNHSFFGFCHVADLKSVGGFFQKLFKLNQVETGQYRMMAKAGGYHWMVTQATVISNQKNHKAQCVVCVHYVISNLIDGDKQLSSEQWECAKALPPPVPVACFDQISLQPVESLESVEDDTIAEDLLVQISETEEVDDCSVAPLTFTELDENDAIFGDDIFFNAPSIGDPWSYSENQEMGDDKIKDLFGDVMLDGGGQQHQAVGPSVSGINNDLAALLPEALNSKGAQFTNDLCGDVPMTSSGHEPDYGGYRSWPGSGGQFTSPTPCGSVSPCDSAYCGSPPHGEETGLPYTPIDLMANVQELEKSPKRAPPLRQPAYQPVIVPSDKYSSHMNNLKRGFVECNSNALCTWPQKQAPHKKVTDPDPAKRRRFDPNNLPLEPNTYTGPAKTSYSDMMNTSSALMQPGDGFGFNDVSQEPSLSSCASFLLQPEMNFNGKQGRMIARNISSGCLPQLSLQDCEVNAPLRPDTDRLPWAVDCVIALDNDF